VHHLDYQRLRYLTHPPTSATGTAWERTPWHAVQRAAWEALKEAETN
jgi:hypothetical protein